MELTPLRVYRIKVVLAVLAFAGGVVLAGIGFYGLGLPEPVPFDPRRWVGWCLGGGTLLTGQSLIWFIWARRKAKANALAAQTTLVG